MLLNLAANFMLLLSSLFPRVSRLASRCSSSLFPRVSRLASRCSSSLFPRGSRLASRGFFLLFQLSAFSFPLFFPLSLAAAAQPSQRSLDLSGDWQVVLRPDAQPFAWDAAAKTIRLPGSIQAQGLGNDIAVNTPWLSQIPDPTWFTSPAYAKYRQPGNIKVPFWLQPDKHFIGTAWYRREIEIPAKWAKHPIRLTLERVHINCQVWLDDNDRGSDSLLTTPIPVNPADLKNPRREHGTLLFALKNTRPGSLSTPHVIDLGPLSPGKHTLTLRIDNSPPVYIGPNSHCVTDNTQTNWNGVVGRMDLTAMPATWLDGLEIYPDVPGKQVRIQWRLGGQTATAPDAKLALTVHAPDGQTFTANAAASAGQAVMKLGDAIATWDEFSPKLYRAEATLTMPDGTTHAASSTFGMVYYQVQGKQFRVNGRPTVFRGTLDCAIFPLTGYPSTDVASWKKEIAAVKAHGLNHIRFHSWCPPDAAFVAADELGCYLQIEHAWTTPDRIGPYLMAEAERVIRTYGNHPSFAIHSYGNEPSGGNRWLENFSAHFRQRDPRRYYSGAAGREAFKNSHFAMPQGPDIRVKFWASGMKSSIETQTPNSLADFGKKTAASAIPVVSHETGQWCVYPDFSEITKYTGFLKARNFEIFRDFLTANHMADQAHDFLMASGRLQTLCYKHEIEQLLRSPDIGGYQLLGLNDFSGQGTALVGAVNPFWETKAYTTPAEYRRFSGPSVPLARLPKFVFSSDESLKADLEICHFAAAPIAAAVPEWKLLDATGKVLRRGQLPSCKIPLGQSKLGNVTVPLSGLPAPVQLKFELGIAGTAIRNDWDIWVYPPSAARATPGNVVITRDPADAWNKASAGAAVLLIPPAPSIVDPEGPKPVLGFSTIFWNTSWTRHQPPTTLGILCDPKHPALRQFPTNFHSNYQWWYLTKLTAKPLSLQGQDPKMRPIVQVIDDWFTARRLGMLVEAQCGNGKILVSAIDFENAPADHLVATQFRKSLLDYMNSPNFAPTLRLTAENYGKIVRSQPAVPKPPNK